MQDMYFLLKSYKDQLRVVRAYYDDLKPLTTADKKAESEIVAGIISDLEHVIEWLETGRRPGAKRDIDRRSVYELTYHMDPVILANYAREEEPTFIVEEEKQSQLSERDRLRIEDALSVLTEAEKDVFMMHYVQLLSLGEIAAIKKVSKSTIQTQIERSKKKIKQQTLCSLFAFAI
jgi:positive control factor